MFPEGEENKEWERIRVRVKNETTSSSPLENFINILDSINEKMCKIKYGDKKNG